MRPYERRPNESNAAWAAFEVYLHLPVERRSVEEAWRTAKGRTTKAPAHWKQWGRDYDWPGRAGEWDRDQAALVRKESMDRVIAVRRRQADELEAAQVTFMKPIRELLRRMVEGELNLTLLDNGTLLKIALAGATLLPKLGERQLELLGDESGQRAPGRDTGMPGEVREVPSDPERMAWVYGVLEEAGVRPEALREEVVDTVAEVRQLPRRAAG